MTREWFGTVLGDGAAYNPVTHRWRLIAPAPIAPRADATGIWTGAEVIVWGGSGGGHGATLDALDAGAAYNPVTNRWRRLPPPPFVVENGGEITAWTGRELLVWESLQPYGSRAPSTVLGAAYNPVTNRWRRLATPPSEVGDIGPELTVWTGRELLVAVSAALPYEGCGNGPGCGIPQPGATFVAYDPRTDQWHTLHAPPVSVEAMAPYSGVVWEQGHLVLVDDRGRVAVGDVFSGQWHFMPDGGPLFCRNPVVVGIGRLVLAQGGGNHQCPALFEAVFDVATSRWGTLVPPPLGPRINATELDAGGRLFIWGGLDDQSATPGPSYNDGAILDVSDLSTVGR